MKLEQSEKLFVATLFKDSMSDLGPQVELDVEKLTGDASTRRYYRVSYLSKSYVVCLDNPTKKDEKNNFFDIQKVFLQNDVRVPKIFDVKLRKGYFLEEDLGDNTLLKEVSLASCQKEEYDFYKSCVDQMIKIHSIDVSKYSSCNFSQLSFDKIKLFDEVNFTMKYFVQLFLNKELKNKDYNRCLDNFKDLCHKLDTKKKVLTHRDFHSRNIMVKGNEVAIIDFQDARMGTPVYDLVSLLEDCYFELNRSNKFELKKYYWDNFLLNKDYYSDYDEFEKLYDFMAIQRVFKAIGSFSYIYKLRKDVRYLKYIGFAFEKLRKIISRHKEYLAIKTYLSKIYYAS